jgi:hypothetical protein
LVCLVSHLITTCLSLAEIRIVSLFYMDNIILSYVAFNQCMK